MSLSVGTATALTSAGPVMAWSTARTSQMRSSPTAVRFLLLLLCSNTHTPPSICRHRARALGSAQQREPGCLGCLLVPLKCLQSLSASQRWAQPGQALRAPDLFQFWGAGWRVRNLEPTQWGLQHLCSKPALASLPGGVSAGQRPSLTLPCCQHSTREPVS